MAMVDDNAKDRMHVNNDTADGAPGHAIRFLAIDPATVQPISRGHGVTTRPYVDHTVLDANTITTGLSEFAPGQTMPLHTHNVEESVFVLSGVATLEVDGRDVTLTEGCASWVAAGVPHKMSNLGDDTLRFYWVFGGRDVTRTLVSTGETYRHLSPDEAGSFTSSRAPGTAGDTT